VRHVGQKFTLTPVCRFGLLPGTGVLLDRLSKIVHHLIDLRLQTVHLSTRFDRDKTGEVSICRCSGDLGECSHLRGEVRSHRVDIEAVCQSRRCKSSSRYLLPRPLDVLDFRLHTQLSFRSYLPGDSRDFCRKDGQLINHIIDSVDQVENLSRHLDTDDLLCQVTTGDCGLIVSASRLSEKLLTVACAIVRTCSVKFAAMILTQSVRSFQVPATPGTRA